MADVQLTRRHCGRKWFKKASGRFKRTGIGQEANFFVVLKFHIIRWFRIIFIQSLAFMLAMHSSKIYMPLIFPFASTVETMVKCVVRYNIVSREIAIEKVQMKKEWVGSLLYGISSEIIVACQCFLERRIDTIVQIWAQHFVVYPIQVHYSCFV